MKTNYFYLVGLSLFTSLLIGQVGVGTVAPDGALDVVSTTDGLLIPRIALSATNVATVVTPVESELVYNTFDSAPGANAVSKGYYYWNGTLWIKLATGASNNDWTLTGNSGTASATNFIGTIDDVDFVFRRNNIRAGFIGSELTNRNTSFGTNSLPIPTALGIRNVALGTNVLNLNTDGNLNVSIGESSMNRNTIGAENTAVGGGALFSNQIGYANVALGRNALVSLNGTTVLEGANNTAVGYESIRQSTLGLNNSALGRASLRNNISGNNNVALGYQSGQNHTGSNNITIGAVTEVPVLANSNQMSIGNVIYGLNMTTTAAGQIGIGLSNPSSKLHVSSNGTPLNSLVNSFTPTTDTSFIRTGINNSVTGATNDVVFGSFNNVTSTGTGSITGSGNQIINGANPNSFITGHNNVVNGNSTTIGNNNFLTNNNTTSIPNGSVTGLNSNLAGTSIGTIKGTDTSIGVSGTGNHYGNFNLLSGNGNTAAGSSHYGNFNSLNGTGTTTKYGSYNIINTTAGGIHYGVYASVLKPGATNFAGYFLGNLGIGTTVANTYTMPASRAVSTGQIMQTDGVGNVTWQTPSAALNSSAWLTTGNSGIVAASNYIGTSDANPIVFRTTAIERMRISATGEVSVGTGVPFAGHKISAYATGTQQAIRGESTLNGRGVIGFNNGPGIATQGENSSTGVGVFGVNTSTGVGMQGQSGNLNGQALVGFNTTPSGTGFGVGVTGQTAQRNGFGVFGFNNGPAGTSFGILTGFSRASVYGDGSTLGAFAFGVMGDGGNSTRSGGVFGDDFGAARGALGYFDSASNDYAVYGFGIAYQTGGVGGRPGSSSAITNNEPNNMVGLGIYGGVMGGWVRGINYGLHVKGKEYGMYVDGNTITNKPVIQLIENGKEKRSVSFTSTSMTADVYVRGNTKLSNGSVYVAFKENFSDIVSDKIPMNVTITPTGESKGVYITDVTNKGFRVMENGNGNSNVAINWVAYGTRLGYENPDEIVSDEILSSKFDENMDAVMYNDSNTDGKEKGIWFDGSQVKTGKMPASFQQAKLNKKKTKEIPKITTFEAETKSK